MVVQGNYSTFISSLYCFQTTAFLGSQNVEAVLITIYMKVASHTLDFSRLNVNISDFLDGPVRNTVCWF